MSGAGLVRCSEVLGICLQQPGILNFCEQCLVCLRRGRLNVRQGVLLRGNSPKEVITVASDCKRLRLLDIGDNSELATTIDMPSPSVPTIKSSDVPTQEDWDDIDSSGSDSDSEQSLRYLVRSTRPCERVYDHHNRSHPTPRLNPSLYPRRPNSRTSQTSYAWPKQRPVD